MSKNNKNIDKLDYIIVDYYYCKKCGKFHYSHRLYGQNQYKHLGFRNHLKYKSFKMKEKDNNRMCDYCNKPLLNNNTTKHINIKINTITLFFCSEKCKALWILFKKEKKYGMIRQNE